MGIKVLSLFDGISCGRVALEKAGEKVDKYYASEINPFAMKITKKNYPDTMMLGDITKITKEMLDELGPIDMIIGGSPCQDLSIYNDGKEEKAKGLEGSKSILFYHYVRILNYLKPKYFLLENVASMKQRWADVISDEVGAEPIAIDSALVSAALRKRLYWTNIPNVTQPEDKGLLIKDIIVPADQVPDKYWYDKPFTYNGDDKKVQCTIHISGHKNMKEVYNINAKCNTLLADGDGGNRQKKVYQDGRCRKFMPIEYERMQCLPDDYTKFGDDGKIISDSARYSAIGNGWTVDIISHIFKGLLE